MQSEIKKVKRKNLILGLVFVGAFAILYLGINFLRGLDIFSTRQFYYIEYSHIDGLLVASPVMLNGFKVGQVTNINFKENDNQSLIVKFIIDQKINIPANTIATIVDDDLFGTKALVLTLGNSTKLAESGSFIQGEVAPNLINSVNEIVKPLVQKVEGILITTDSLVLAVNKIFNEKNISNVENSIENIKNITESFEAQSQYLKNTISNVESITSNIEANNKKIDNILTNISTISDSLALSNIKSAIQNTEQVMFELKEITQKINEGQGTAGMLINDDSLYHKLNSTSKELELLLNDIRKNPSKYINIRVFGKQ